MANHDNAGGLPPVPPEQQIRAQALLASSRDLVAGLLAVAWRELLVTLEQDLQQRADLAGERDSRQFLHGLRDKLLASAGQMEELLAEKWRQEFAAALAERTLASRGQFKPADLQLVDLGDFDEDLALKAFVRGFEEASGEAVYAVGRRVAVLIGGRRSSDSAAAAAPDVIGAALRSSLAGADFGSSERIEVLRCLTNCAGTGLASVYEQWNAQLVSLNVLPDLKRSYVRSAESSSGVSAPVVQKVAGADVFALLQGAAAGLDGNQQQASAAARTVDTAAALAALDRLQRTASEPGTELVAQSESLRQFRASDIGQGLGQLDAITVDIVAMLFDMIYQDDAIADPIKVLFGRLQIPLLKVALADRRVFSSRAHPARRFLEQVSHAAVQLGRNAGREDALYGKLVAIIERLQREFSHDAALFDELCLELEGFLAEQNRAADEQASAGVPLAEAHERRLLAQVAAEQALAPYLAAAPDPVKELLGHEWRDLLARAELETDRVAWDAALSTAEELLASVRIAPGRRGKKEFIGRLPGLIKRIQEGFDLLNVEQERRVQLIDALFALHAGLVAGDAKTAGAAPPAAVRVEARAGDAAQEQVAQLQRGHWVELARGNGVVQRYRISWISPTRGVLLLTNRTLPKGIALTPQALALSIERGRASIVPSEPIFERAMVRAVNTLSDEEAAKVSLDFT